MLDDLGGHGVGVRADLVPDDLWERVAPLLLLTPERRLRHPGRLRVPDRLSLAGVIYVLRTGVAWRDAPAETVGCSGVTAWRRLRDWAEAGVWPRLHAALPTGLRHAGLLDLNYCSVGGSHIRAVKGGGTSTPRPCPPRLQAPPDRRPSRDPARRHAHRRQPVRCHPAHAAAGRHPIDSGTAGMRSPQTAAPVRRPGLRLRQVPPPAVEARHQAHDRPTRRRPRLRTGQGALGCRARFPPGCTSSNGSAPAMSDAQISTRACSNWPAASYAFAVSEPHPETISWLR